MQAGAIDGETDVIVVGSGPAGFCAAVAAYDAGAEVLVLEADGVVGGNAARSTAYLAAANTRIQPNKPSDFLNAMKNVARVYGIEDRLELDLCTVYAEKSGETIDWLIDLGLKVEHTLVPRPYPLHWLKKPELFRECWEMNLVKRKIKVLTETKAIELERSPSGEVCGVKAQCKGKTSFISARKGVVLATGGYQANPNMRKKFGALEIAEGAYVGTELCKGDGIIMAQALGADIAQLDLDSKAENMSVHIASKLAQQIIAVNREGKRFMDECASPYIKRIRALYQQPEQFAYWLLDSRTMGDWKMYVEDLARWTPLVKASTIEELAQKTGINQRNLRQTIADWNETVRKGSPDSEFGRVMMPAKDGAIETAPFYALKCITAVILTIGGLKTDSDTRVLDVFGKVIPRLYAAGQCVQGVLPAWGLGGVFIGSALTFGRIAGIKAASDSALLV